MHMGPAPMRLRIPGDECRSAEARRDDLAIATRVVSVASGKNRVSRSRL